MDTKRFLGAVLGESGYYCLVGIKNNKTIQNFYDSLSVLEDAANKLDAAGYDTYFALGTFKQNTSRKADNVEQLKTLFLDLDCGVDKPYKTQQDAVIALRGFYKKYALPPPTAVVNSGRGVHVYWVLSTACTKEQWYPVAEQLKSACAEHGLDADPVVTSDAARILRVPGTHNFKTSPPTPVRLLRIDDKHVDITAFAAKLPESSTSNIIAREFSDEDRKDMAAAVGGEKYRKKFIKLAAASLNGGGCKQVRRAFLEPNSVSYADWLHVLSIAKHCEDGATAVHVVSKGYDGYDPVETDKIAASIDTPHLCMTFEKDNPTGCEGCPHKGKIRSPIKLCMEVKEAETNTVEVPVQPQETAEAQDSEDSTGESPAPTQTTTVTIPEYPFPYFRGVAGGVYIRNRDKDGNPKDDLIYKRDLYLTKRMRDPMVGPCYEIVHHTAREGLHTFVATAVQLSSPEEFRKCMAMNDIFVLTKEAGELMRYIARWVEELKNTSNEIKVRTQFGWTDNRKSFVIGGEEVFADKVLPNPPGGRTAQYFSHFERKGTLEGWKRVVKFYNREGFEEHQYMFGLSFGSPLMDMVPNIAGCIFHAMSSETGHGKTTGMWGGASVWGNHKRLVLHGKDTDNSAWNRAEVYKNIVLYIDEISNFKSKDASDFAYAVSDGEQRNRLSSSGQNLERYRGEEWSLNCGTSGNGSLLETIAGEYRANPKGEAGRVIEAVVHQRLFGTEGAMLATKLNEDLGNNYGHAGVVYIQHVLQNYDKVKKLVSDTRKIFIQRAGLEAQHRHWSAQAATVFSGLLIAKEIGLIDWDLKALFTWIVQKLKAMKSGLKEMDIDIGDLVAQFYADNVRSILRIRSQDTTPLDKDMENALSNIGPADSPNFRCVGRHEYDINTFYIRPTALKQWCAKHGHHFQAIRDMMAQDLEGVPMKMRLGRGTKLDMPPQWVIKISWDMEKYKGTINDKGATD